MWPGITHLFTTRQLFIRVVITQAESGTDVSVGIILFLAKAVQCNRTCTSVTDMLNQRSLVKVDFFRSAQFQVALDTDADFVVIQLQRAMYSSSEKVPYKSLYLSIRVGTR